MLPVIYSGSICSPCFLIMIEIPELSKVALQ